MCSFVQLNKRLQLVSMFSGHMLLLDTAHKSDTSANILLAIIRPRFNFVNKMCKYSCATFLIIKIHTLLKIQHKIATIFVVKVNVFL